MTLGTWKTKTKSSLYASVYLPFNFCSRVPVVTREATHKLFVSVQSRYMSCINIHPTLQYPRGRRRKSVITPDVTMSPSERVLYFSFLSFQSSSFRFLLLFLLLFFPFSPSLCFCLSLSTCLSVSVSFYFSVSVSVRLSVCISILSVCLSVSLKSCLDIELFH